MAPIHTRRRIRARRQTGPRGTPFQSRTQSVQNRRPQRSQSVSAGKAGPFTAGGRWPARPPRPEARTRTSAAHSPAPAARPAYQLSAVLRDGPGAVAVINGLFVRVGQQVGAARVVWIGPAEAVLEESGVRYKLTLK